MTWHDRLPWRGIRGAYRWIRSTFFGRPRHEGRVWLIEHPAPDLVAPEVEAALGRRSYAPNWETSYYKRGEDINLARVDYHIADDRSLRPTPSRPGRCWWQVHVRGWATERGLELQAHWELEPTENPAEHIRGEGVNVPSGMSVLREDLLEAGFDPRETQYRR